MILIIIFSCMLGLLLGFFVPVIPYAYTKYMAIGIMAAFDSIIGAISGVVQKKFDIKIFVSGFFVNMFIAIAFTILGESLNVDIALAAIVVFVFRIFNNLSTIRRQILMKLENKKEKEKRVIK